MGGGGGIRRSIISLRARLSTRGPCEMSKRLACLRGWLIARCGCSLGCYRSKDNDKLTSIAIGKMP